MKIVDRYGNVLKEYKPTMKEVLSEETAYLMTDLMRSVVREGTGGRSRWKYGFMHPAAGKTGTTDDFSDAWFVGFTPRIAAGVWVGIDDPRVSLGEGQSGAIAALPIWARFMSFVHDTLGWDKRDFVRPEGVVEMEVCAETGDLPTPYCPLVAEIFNRKYLPTGTCEVHTGVTRERRRGRIEF